MHININRQNNEVLVSKNGLNILFISSKGWLEEDNLWMNQINRLEKLIDRLEQKVCLIDPPLHPKDWCAFLHHIPCSDRIVVEHMEHLLNEQNPMPVSEGPNYISQVTLPLELKSCLCPRKRQLRQYFGECAYGLKSKHKTKETDLQSTGEKSACCNN